MKANLDRRSFLKGAAVFGSAAAVSGLAACSPEAASEETSDQPAASEGAGSAEAITAENYKEPRWAFMTPPEPVADDQITETYTADIIIVGSGPSGLCTAVSCQEAGGDVMVLSASVGPVGRGGSNCGFDTDVLREAGIDWTPQVASKTIRARTYYSSYSANWKLWSKWMKNSRETVNWMVEHMKSQGLKVQIEDSGYDDPDGIFTTKSHSHCFYTDDEVMGMNTGAPLQAKAWSDIFQANGGEIHYETTAKYLIRDNDNTGRVSAVVAQTADGSYVKFEANKAVVLATGDFAKDPDMMACYAPETYEAFKDLLASAPLDYSAEKVFTGTMPGDGHKMGLWVGAAWQKAPVGPMLMGMIPGPMNGYGNFYGINLDMNGKRFHNEVVMDGIAGKAFMKCPGGIAFSVWDSDYYYTRETWHAFGNTVDGSSGVPVMTADEMKDSWDKNAETGMCYKADTLDELLDLLAKDGLDKEAAKASIETYNSYAEAGEDPEFLVNPSCLHPIKTGPFYGGHSNASGFLCMCGGLRTNENMQVCDDNDEPIEGLYNTGIMTGDMFPNGYTYVLCGAAMGGISCTLSNLLGKDLAAL